MDKQEGTYKSPPDFGHWEGRRVVFDAPIEINGRILTAVDLSPAEQQ